MKKTIRNLSGLVCLSAILFTADIALAQTASTTTTTTSDGTISQFGPNSIVVQSPTSANPLTYSYTKTTTYVDENGNPVSVQTVKSGEPVTVYYDQQGNQMVATKVVVRKTSTTVDPNAPMTQATTTTSDGTISQFGPNSMVVQSSASANPVTYAYSKTTTYMDENGNPVSVQTIKSGQPVTVYYDQQGNQMVATKVIVKKTTTTTAP